MNPRATISSLRPALSKTCLSRLDCHSTKRHRGASWLAAFGLTATLAFGELTPIVVVSSAENYLPVSDPEITWEKLDIDRVWTSEESHHVYSDGDCNRTRDIHVDLKIRASNGVVYSTSYYRADKWHISMPCDDWDYTVNHDLSGAEARAALEGQINGSFVNEKEAILREINAAIASNQNGLPLPAPNPLDNRRLAVPILFIHGKGDSAERWGGAFARRVCENPAVLSVSGGTLNSAAFYSTEKVQQTAYNSSTGKYEPVFTQDQNGKQIPVMVSGQVKRYRTRLINIQATATCLDGTNLTSPLFNDDSWIQPGSDPDNSSSFPASAPRFLAPKVDPAVRTVHYVIAIPGVKIAGGTEVPDLDAELLKWQNDASTSYSGKYSEPFFYGLTGWKNTRVVNWNDLSWTIYRVDVTFEEVAKLANYTQELTAIPYATGTVLANGSTMTHLANGHSAQKDALVSRYADGSAPDILARLQHLDRTYRWWDPYHGINANGIYFYSAWNGIFSKIGSPPAAWNPAQYPTFLSEGDVSFGDYSQLGFDGQALQLYHRMIEVLDAHYGAGLWQTSPEAKIDLVAHSQGGLLVRDMLAHANDATLPDGITPMPQGLAHPGAHIRKFVALNSPHFGSALAAKDADVPTEFSSIKTFKDWMKNEQTLRPETKIDAEGYAALATDAAVAGGCAGGAAIGSVVPGAGTGVGCVLGGLGAGLYSLIAGTDAYWSMSGKALGPYNLHFFVDFPGPWNYDGDNPIDPPAMSGIRDQLLKDEQWGYHLSGASRWITDMQRAGYPIISDATGIHHPLWTQPLFTPGLPKLRGDIAEELGHIQSEFCDDHADDWIETCDVVSWMLTGAAGYGGDDQGLFYTFFRKFHDEWTTKSDILVEATSQTMIKRGTTFDPNNSSVTGYFQEPKEYLLQRQFGTGSSKEVAHGPINLSEDLSIPGNTGAPGVTTSTHHMEVHRPGAPRMGPDIYAALYDDGFLTQGVQPLSATVQPVQLPAPASALVGAGRLAGDLGVATQEVAASGNFSVKAWSQDRLVQGVGVRESGTSSLQVAVFYDRRQGSFLWTAARNGQPTQRVAVGGPNVPPTLSLARQGNTWTATATFQDGQVRTASVTTSLPSNVRVGVLSSSEGRSEAVTPALLMGSINAAADTVVAAAREWNLETYVREMSGDQNQSKPRMVLVNADSRTLRGVYLEYWFTSDSARQPVVEFDRLGNATWEVQHFGGDQYVLKIRAPQAVVPPGAVYPDADGFSFRIHNSDWSPRWNRGDWSRDRNIGVARKTTRIVVRDVTGRILAGELPSQPDPLTLGRVRLLARDAGTTEANTLKPEIRLRNIGTVPLRNYKVLWYVRLPAGTTPVVEQWSGSATLSQRSLGNGLWEISARFGPYALFPQQDASELKLGIHLGNWSPWDKSQSPSRPGSDWAEYRGLVVLDGVGRRLWGDLPAFPLDTISGVTPPDPPIADLRALTLSARDENPGDPLYARPRIKLTNTGTTPIQGFQLGVWVNNPGGPQPVLDAAWYVPGCDVSVTLASVGQKVNYRCTQVTVAPGAVWPDPAGSVIGLHLPQWQAWSRSTSWSLAGLTSTFAPSDHITIENLDGTVAMGTRP